MCGIAGIGNKEDELDVSAAVEDSLERMRHRGPDDKGTEQWNRCCLGMCRLSIIDIESGHQPIWNEDRSMAIVLNGEVYNYLELRHELVVKGHKFYTKTDTEVLLHLYEEYGERMLGKLRGMFAFSIWDEKNQELFLARDRMGQKPLYYFVTADGAVAFASELKALKVLAKRLSFPLKIRDQSIYDYLSFGIPEPWTIYDGVYCLKPGYWMRVNRTGMESQSYWTLTRLPKVEMSYQEAQKCLRDLIRETVKLQLRSDVPLGVFLSGGMDSSVITYEASREIGSTLTAFTVATPGFETDESAIAKRTARALGIRHQILDMKIAPKDYIFKVVEHYDQPFSDSSAIPSMAISKLASNYVKVVLNGDGGDEVFGGYRRYVANRHFDLWGRYVPSFIWGLLGKVLGGCPGSRRSALGFLRRIARGSSQSPAMRFLTWTNDQLNDSDKRSWWIGKRQSPTEALIENKLKEISNYSWVDRQIELDRAFILPGLLVKMDMASMAASLEARSPFLDHKIVEFAALLPDSYKVGLKMGKRILRDAYSGLLSDEVTRGKKKGFEIPLYKWLTDDLKDLTTDALLNPNAMIYSYLDKTQVHLLAEQKIMREKNWAYLMYALLILELWLQRERKNIT